MEREIDVNYWELFKNYFKLFSGKYTFVNPFLVSIILSFCLLELDKSNVIISFVNKQKDNLIPYIFLLSLVVIFTVIKFKVVRMVKSPLINKFDKVIMIILFTQSILALLSMIQYENMTFLYGYICPTLFFNTFILLVRIFFTWGYYEYKESNHVDLLDIIEW